MKKVLAVTVASAALMFSGSVYAQDASSPEQDIYVTDDGGQRMVHAGDNMTPLLEGTGGAAPADCAEGSYYSVEGDQGELIFPCGNTDVSFGLFEPGPSDMMSSGEPYPQDSWVMRRATQEGGDAKQTESSPAGAAN